MAPDYGQQIQAGEVPLESSVVMSKDQRWTFSDEVVGILYPFLTATL